MSAKAGLAQIATANTNRDGTGTLGSVYTAGSNGSQITKVEFRATGTTTVGVLRIFVYDGTNNRLIREYLVTAITPSDTVKVFEAEVSFSPALPLSSGWILKASTHVAETFNVLAYGNDL